MLFLVARLPWDHPRVCGKNWESDPNNRRGTGSPPRVREKRCTLILVTSLIRITPACAGKTKSSLSLRSLNWDHPRVCGKNPQRYLSTVRFSGSPPRVREKLNLDETDDTALRITPACAGKTTTSVIPELRPRDHPRVCGKNASGRLRCLAPAGSPPRVREKLTLPKSSSDWIGITPACAGKTISFYLPLLEHWDHPRVCGKNRPPHKRE